MRSFLIGLLLLALASSSASASPCYTQPDPLSPAYLCVQGTISIGSVPVYVDEPVTLNVTLRWPIDSPASSISSFYFVFSPFATTNSSGDYFEGVQTSLNVDGAFVEPGPAEVLMFLTDNLGGFGCAGGDNGPGCTPLVVDVLPQEVAGVPEPSTWVMLLLGLAGLAFLRRSFSKIPQLPNR